MNKWIYTIVFFLCVWVHPLWADEFPHDGFIRLYHSHLDELLEVNYEVEGVLNQEALNRINHLMRSRDRWDEPQGSVFPKNSVANHGILIQQGLSPKPTSVGDRGNELQMDPDLIRLIDHIQDHFGADTVEVICGYRSPEYNAYLKDQGRGVAEKSNHMRGIAVDIHLDEIVEKDLYRYVWNLKKGGVGYYPDFLMVHVDLGRVHTWQDGNFSNRLDIGIFNDKSDVSLRTDQLFYFSGDQQKLLLSHASQKNIIPEMILEWFYRGKWVDLGRRTCPTSNKHHVKIIADPKQINMRGRFWSENDVLDLPYGKFRWKVFTQEGDFQYSNEFYLKKK